MRPLLAVLVNVAVFGGMALYISLQEEPAPQQAAPEQAEAAGSFALEIVTTFGAEPDPFDLPGDNENAAALVVNFRGQEILRWTERIAAGEPVRVEPLEGIKVGENEFFITAKPPLDQSNRAHAIRVRILKDGAPLVEKTIWSEPGHPVAGIVELPIASKHVDEKDKHGH